jgi:hypothetical protein
VSQEQKNHVVEGVSVVPTASDSAAVEETQKVQEGQEPEGTVDTTAVPVKKRGKRKTKLVNVEEISPRPSYWPIILAFSFALVLFGIVAGPIVVGIGIVLVVVSLGGWILERR